MNIRAPEQTMRRTRRSEPVILFGISGQMFAINANAIHEIRSTDSISAAAVEISSPVVTKVRHLVHRGKTFFFVVDGCAHFGLPPSRAAHVVILRTLRVAVLVESIEKMESISVLMPLPAGFSGPERQWYRGITLISDNAIPVVDPAGFLTKKELAELETVRAQMASSAPASNGIQDMAPEQCP